MSPRSVRILHVEDDGLQQVFVKHILSGIPGLEVTLLVAGGEAQALELFRTGCDLVLLDYQLDDGNGLSCLQKMKAENPVVPVLALSGALDPAVQAELLEAGADDFFAKSELNVELLRRGVCDALARADARRTHEAEIARLSEVRAKFAELCSALRPALASHQHLLDEFESLARSCRLTQPQAIKIFDAITRDNASTRRLLRPILLEIVLRLYGAAT